MLAYDFAVVARLEINAVAFFEVDVQVIGPERDHDLVQLPLGIDRAEQRVPADLLTQHVLVIFEARAGLLMDGFESAGAKIAGRVIDRARIELLVNPGLGADLPHAIGFPRPWP